MKRVVDGAVCGHGVREHAPGRCCLGRHGSRTRVVAALASWGLGWVHGPVELAMLLTPSALKGRLTGLLRGSPSTSMRAVLLSMVLPLGACSNCDGTNLAVTPINRSALTGPVTLEARLTSGGDPVRGAPILFFIRWEGSEKVGGGRRIGSADTDARGFARISFQNGLAKLQPSSAVTGYAAEFRVIGSVPGRENELCRTQSEFEFA